MFYRIIPLWVYFTLVILSPTWSQLPPDFYDSVVLSDLEFPTGVTFDERGYAYVWEKRGMVWVIDSSGQRLASPLLDIREEVTNWRDHGLLGFCLDNDFLQNGYFYALYAVDWHHYQHFGTTTYHSDTTTTHEPTFGRVTRYQATAVSDFTEVNPELTRILLGTHHTEGIPLLFEFHGLGSLLQATDGSLLISVGDATSNVGTDIGGDDLGTMISQALEMGIITPDQDVGSYRSQYLGSLDGKVLRISSETGDGLSSNPFFAADKPRAAVSRVWALGLRNPYRMVLRPESGSHYPADGRPGQLMIGDVGNGAWEELNIATEGGQNFGWPIYEGFRKYWSFTSNDVPDNLMAPNPLYQVGACAQSHFNFRDLLGEPRPTGFTWPVNPCNASQAIPAELHPMIPTQAVIRWSNAKWNMPTRAQVPSFDDSDKPVGLAVDDPGSTIESEHFDGYSSLGGVYYTGTRFPESYQQQYFHLDYSGWIKVFRFDEANQLTAVERFHDYAKDIIHLAYNPYDEALYYINISGELHKISYGGNQAPLARIEASQPYGPGPLEVELDARSSTDPNGDTLSYTWDFGDGETASGPVVQHIFGSNNTELQSFRVRLEVTDAHGAKSEASLLISPNNTPPVAHIISFRDGDRYPTDRSSLLSLRASAQDAEHTEEDLQYEWRAFVHHNDHVHPEPVDYAKESFYLVSPLGCTQGEEYWYEIRLKVTDAAGLFTERIQHIYPNCADLVAGQTILSGETVPDGTRLDWPLAPNGVLQKLELQRSYDYLHFDVLRSYDQAELTVPATFDFHDQNPVAGTLIYRLKLYAEDGRYDYSNLVSLTYPTPPAYLISPNPGPGVFELTVQRPTANTVQFELFAVSGQRLRRISWPGVNQAVFQERIHLEDLPQGIYFYRVVSGSEDFGGKLIIE